jgi:cadmium resistance transport/sequestration family protein
MIRTLLTAAITSLATSLDEIPVLFLIYRKAGSRGRAGAVTLAYTTGTILLLAAGILGSLGLNLIPVKWLIGIIGLVPIWMGFRILILGEEEEEQNSASDLNQYGKLWIRVLAITIGLGADDLGVYIPLFTTLSATELLLMLPVFLAVTALLCLISYRLTGIDKLSALIERFERFMEGIVFIGIGILVLIECGTVGKLIELIFGR